MRGRKGSLSSAKKTEPLGGESSCCFQPTDVEYSQSVQAPP